MRELEPLSFDRALRAAARELERRKKTGEPSEDALPDFLLDEETLHWLRELRAKDPLALALELWLLRLREQSEFGTRRAELSRAHRDQPHAIVQPEQARRTLTELLRLALARPRERAAYLRSYFASSATVAERVLRLWEERQLFAERLRAPLASFEVASEAIAQQARAFLESTRSAFETLQVREPAQLLSTLLAETAAEGWPARLSQRTTLDLPGRSDSFSRLAAAAVRAAGGARRRQLLARVEPSGPRVVGCRERAALTVRAGHGRVRPAAKHNRCIARHAAAVARVRHAPLGARPEPRARSAASTGSGSACRSARGRVSRALA